MIVYTPPRAATCIPLIDLTDSFVDADARAATALAMHKAARGTGFFTVTGHQVPEAVMAGQLDATRALFALNDAAKQAMHVSHSPCRRGYEGVGAQVLDSGSPADLKESFMLGRDLAPEHPHVQAGLPMQGANQWPPPAALPDFRAQVLAYQPHMIRLGTHLMGCLAMSVGLNYDYFADGLAEPQCGMRLLRYPPQPGKIGDNRLGAGAHSDWGSLTILLQDDVGGLEVRNADGEWIVAAPMHGTFVINLGQMMERFTGGLYCANLHRVRNARGDIARYSVATFFELDPTYRMARAETCAGGGYAEDMGHGIDCAPTIGEHLEAMARASYGG